MSKYLSIMNCIRGWCNKTMINQSCCFTGHRRISKADMPLVLHSTEKYIRLLIDQGVTHFYVGGALGYDTLVAELLFRLRDTEFPQIEVILAYPFDGYMNCWTEKQRQKGVQLLSFYDKVVCISKTDSKEAYLQRNRYLVENTKHCVCYCNRNWGGTAYTVKYAKQSGLTIYNTCSFDVKTL